MTTLTFRDFAGALMGGDAARASAMLSELLGVDAATAGQATKVFEAKLAEGPAFIQKAMSMRGAVESKDAAGLSGLLVQCFGLGEKEAGEAAERVLARYG